MTTHFSYAVRIDPAGVATASLIHAIDQQSVTPQSELNNEVSAGSPYPQFVGINAQKNEATVSTKDISNAIDILGTEGVAVENNGVEFFQIEIDPETGFPKSTAVHNVLQIKRGKIVPMRLSCEHQRDATLEIRTYATKDPSTDDSAANLPIVKLTSQALPTGLAGDERYTLHSIDVAGATFTQNLSLDIDFGLEIQTAGANSDIHDSDVLVLSVKPTITIGGKNLANFVADIGLLGAAATHANTAIYLRRRSAAKAGFTTGLTDHIKITVDALADWQEVHSTSGNNQIDNRIRLTTRHDGTNKPIIIQTGTALP